LTDAMMFLAAILMVASAVLAGLSLLCWMLRSHMRQRGVGSFRSSTGNEQKDVRTELRVRAQLLP
jgi:hypothetical protein